MTITRANVATVPIAVFRGGPNDNFIETNQPAYIFEIQQTENGPPVLGKKLSVGHRFVVPPKWYQQLAPAPNNDALFMLIHRCGIAAPTFAMYELTSTKGDVFVYEYVA